ncbi:MAG: cell wall-binding repeat-containing protein, partial [Actinomycetota bacterium]|nr:cell wall-binding repeat-containing protein [Actinomycetota bacterium]
TNTGDIELFDVTVTEAGDLVNTFAPIPVGGSDTFTSPISVQDDFTIDAEASGTYGDSGTALFGEISDEVSGQLDTRIPEIQITVRPEFYEVAVGTSVEVTYTVLNSGDTDLFDVEISDSSGLRFEANSLVVGASALFVRSMTPGVGTLDLDASVQALYGTVATAFTGVTHSDSGLTELVVRNPALQLDIVPVNSEVIEGVSVDVEYTITNSGDTDLHDVQVVDSSAQVLFSGLSLDAGEDVILVRAVPVTENVTLSAKAVGTYGAAATTFYGEVDSAIDSASIEVVESRIAGASRYATAIELSKAAFDGPLTGEKAVVIASGAGWADALPASALAGAVNGPLLLSAPTYVPTEVLAEIDRLGAQKAYVVGGEVVLTPNVIANLKSAGLTVVRVAGTSRYGTAQAVATAVASKVSVNTVFVATGANFPDALAASSLAAALKAPILLTRADSLPAETQAALQALKPANVIICGGELVVSPAVAAALGSSAFGSLTVTREAGTGRYDTALRIIERGQARTGVSDPAGVFVATGTNYPDALAGGVLAGIGGSQWRPLMLVYPDDPATFSPQLSTLVDSNPSIGFATVLGGVFALDEEAETYILGLVR